MNANIEKLTFVVEHRDTETGDLWHEASPKPLKSRFGTIVTKTLGIGRVDDIGRIKPLTTNEVDRETLFNFLINTNQLLKAA